MIVWHGYDFFVAIRGVDYYAEKPIRLLYVTGFAVWLATGLAFWLSRRREAVTVRNDAVDAKSPIAA
jgi:hypothetical protein